MLQKLNPFAAIKLTMIFSQNSLKIQSHAFSRYIKYFIFMKSCIQRDKKRQWCAQENQLLKQLYPNFSSKKWKKISQIFQQKGYDRSELQIRQRWTNFEDPSLLFTEWTDEQLENLYKSYTKFGSKWCFIKRTIPGRTQNKIKNKFYGNIRIFLRFVVNYFNNTKEDTMWIHKINPSILNDIYKGTEQFSAFGNQMEISIQQMGYNVDKIKLLSRIQIQQEKYRDFYDELIQLYKSIEEKKQKSRRKGKKQSNEQSEPNYGSVYDQEEQQEECQQISDEQKINHTTPKYEMAPLSFQYGNDPNPMSMMSHYDPNPQSMTFSRQPTFESSNFPLIQFQGINPYYPNWFYPN